MNPKVSVIMGVYNGAKHLRESIESILGQTFVDFEFIIVNDGSRDRSREIVVSHSDPRIVLIDNDRNQGLTKSLNIALRVARGEFIARQDADDISERERLAVEVGFLERFPEVGLVGTHAAFFDQKGRVFSAWEPPLQHEDIARGMQRANCFCHGSVMMRKSCLDGVGFYREVFKCSQDYDLFLRICERSRTANIGQLLYRLRRSPETISRTRYSEQLDFHLLAMELAKERQRTGGEGLATLPNEPITSVLQSRYRMSGATIKRFKAEMFLAKFAESIESRDYRDAIAFWSAAFSLEPRPWKVKVLARRLWEALAGSR